MSWPFPAAMSQQPPVSPPSFLPHCASPCFRWQAGGPAWACGQRRWTRSASIRASAAMPCARDSGAGAEGCSAARLGSCPLALLPGDGVEHCFGPSHFGSAVFHLHPASRVPSSSLSSSSLLPAFPCSGGHSQKPLVLHVGRLGAEKNLHLLRGYAQPGGAGQGEDRESYPLQAGSCQHLTMSLLSSGHSCPLFCCCSVLEQCPGARLAFVGDGPSRWVAGEESEVNVRKKEGGGRKRGVSE